MPEIIILGGKPGGGSAAGGPPPAGSPWEFIWDILKGIAGAIFSSLTSALTTTAKELAQMVTLNNLIGAGINYLKDEASTALTKALADIGHQEWLANFLHAFGLDFEDLANAARNALGQGFNVLTSELTSTLKEANLYNWSALSLVNSVLGDHGDKLKETLEKSSAATQIALSDHASLLSDTFGKWTLFQANNYAAEEEKLRASLHAIFEDNPYRIQERAKLQASSEFQQLQVETVESMGGQMPEVSGVAAKILRPLQEELNKIVLSVRSAVYSLLVPQIPVSYEKVGVTAAEAFGAAVGFGMAAHGLACAADLLHPLKATGVPQIAAFLADMAGFGAIARWTWYEDLRNFLGVPYQHYSLRYFRPAIPRESEICRLYAENCIDEADFRLAMQYWGYRDAWIDAYLRDVYKDPTARDLSLMLEDPTLKDSDVYYILRDGAYSPHSSEIFTRALRKKSLAAYMASYRQALQDLYAAGYIDDRQLDDLMEPLQLTSEATLLVKKTAQLMFAKTFLDQQIKIYSDMFEKGLWDEGQFRTALTSLGISETKRDLVIDSIKVKLQAKVVADEKKEVENQIRQIQQKAIETYILAFRSGSITETELEQYLQAAGLSADMARVTVALELQKKAYASAQKTEATRQRIEAQVRSNFEDAYIQLFRNGIIDEGQLRVFLSTLGLADDYIDSVVMLEVFKKRKPPKVNIH